jgi:hypothetical protein
MPPVKLLVERVSEGVARRGSGRQKHRKSSTEFLGLLNPGKWPDLLM